jgi:hypothetical protein
MISLLMMRQWAQLPKSENTGMDSKPTHKNKHPFSTPGDEIEHT